MGQGYSSMIAALYYAQPVLNFAIHSLAAKGEEVDDSREIDVT
jgi:hypothetical protein